MSGETLSPNMNMPIPGVGVTSGPTYGSDINTCLSIIDNHNHTPGQGVQIPTSGLNINAALSFGGNDATALRSVSFTAQNSNITTPDTAFVKGVDLFYTDGNANVIQLTQNGMIAGSSGSIAGLTSPASATYVSGTKTFVWQSAANTSANLDCGSVLIREVLAGAKSVKISSPSSLAADYVLVLPTGLPGSTSFATIDTSGNIAASISTTQGITRGMQAAVGQQVSASCGSFNTTSTSLVDVTNLTVTLVTTGRPVMLMCIAGDASDNANIRVSSTTIDSPDGIIAIDKDGSSIATFQIDVTAAGATQAGISYPPGSVCFFDVPTAASHTYKIRTKIGTAGSRIFFNTIKLIAYEL